MKLLRNVFLTVMAILLIGLNLKIGNDNVDANEISLKNIQTMQVSAGEMYCDGRTTDMCSYTIGGTTYYALGKLCMYWN